METSFIQHGRISSRNRDEKMINDEEIGKPVKKEIKRQGETLQLIAAENITSLKVLSHLSTILGCKTAEGTTGWRYHAGCQVIDEIERSLLRNYRNSAV